MEIPRNDPAPMPDAPAASYSTPVSLKWVIIAAVGRHEADSIICELEAVVTDYLTVGDEESAKAYISQTRHDFTLLASKRTAPTLHSMCVGVATGIAANFVYNGFPTLAVIGVTALATAVTYSGRGWL